MVGSEIALRMCWVAAISWVFHHVLDTTAKASHEQSRHARNYRICLQQFTAMLQRYLWQAADVRPITHHGWPTVCSALGGEMT